MKYIRNFNESVVIDTDVYTVGLWRYLEENCPDGILCKLSSDIDIDMLKDYHLKEDLRIDINYISVEVGDNFDSKSYKLYVRLHQDSGIYIEYGYLLNRVTNMVLHGCNFDRIFVGGTYYRDYSYMDFSTYDINNFGERIYLSSIISKYFMNKKCIEY